MNTSLCTTLTLVLAPASASAQLIAPLSQERTISAAVTVDGPGELIADSGDDHANDFGAFVSSRLAEVQHPEASGTSEAVQDSNILPSAIVAQGSISINAFTNGYAWDAFVDASSLTHIEFRIDTKARFDLAGTLVAVDEGLSLVELSTTGGEGIAGFYNAFGGTVPFSESGVLEPGDYEVRFRAWSAFNANEMPYDLGVAIAEFDVSLDLTPLSGNYCTAALNSTGVGARLAVGGSQNLADNDFSVEAAGARPLAFGLIYYGPNQVQVPFGDGFRCVGGMTHRVQPPVQADASGQVTKPIDFTAPPAGSGPGQILPDSTWNFQLWYRDPMGPGGTGYNLSDGLWVTFCP